MFIAYNNSKNHYGSKGAAERPERVQYTINELKKSYPLENFINETYHDDDTALNLIKNVHSLEYITELQNYTPKDFICRVCSNRVKNTQLYTFETFINLNLKCDKCNVEFDMDNVFAYASIDTYITPYTYDIVLNGIYNLKLLLDVVWRFISERSLVQPPQPHRGGPTSHLGLPWHCRCYPLVYY